MTHNIYRPSQNRGIDKFIVLHIIQQTNYRPIRQKQIQGINDKKNQVTLYAVVISDKADVGEGRRMGLLFFRVGKLQRGVDGFPSVLEMCLQHTHNETLSNVCLAMNCGCSGVHKVSRDGK